MFAAAAARGQNPPETAASFPNGFEERAKQETGAKSSLFAILAHKPNYLLPATYASSIGNPAYSALPDIGNKLHNTEVKFQISFKIPVWEGLLGGKADIYAAYTQLALWQAYNARISAPFREINYEPEAFLRYRTSIEEGKFRLNYVAFGFNHQSNGQIEPVSRSWNRLITAAAFQHGHDHFILRHWVRLPEKAKDDDNPGISSRMGHGDLLYTRGHKKHSFSLLVRNNLRTRGNKGAFQADWVFPLHKHMKGYVQFFTGYGESLIGYDKPVTRGGVGISLTGWI
jgi:phospholipase A1